MAIAIQAAGVEAVSAIGTSRPQHSEAVNAPLAAATVAPIFFIPEGGSGWIGFDVTEGGHIVIPVVLNGTSVRALVDTGFYQLVIAKAFAEANHLPLTPTGTSASFGGPTAFYSTPSATLDIGAIRTIKPGYFSVTDLARLSDNGFGHIDAVIGMSLLATLGWEVDQDNHRIRMFESKTRPVPNGFPVRFDSASSRLITDLAVNGQPVPSAMIDTGSDGQVALSDLVARAVGFRAVTDLAAVGAGGVSVESLGRLTDFRIGQCSLSGVYATSSSSSFYEGREVKALVGMGILRNFNMIVDVPAGLMGLVPRVSAPLPLRKSTFGAQGFYRGDRWSIAHIMKNSPAAMAGLRDGQAICGIDGKPMSSWTNSSWGSASPGTQYKVQLCNGPVHMITLQAFY